MNDGNMLDGPVDLPRDGQVDEWGTNLDDVDGGNLGGGGIVEKEGEYHFEISDVIPEKKEDEFGVERPHSIRFDMVVLHTVPKQSPEHSRHFHRLYIASTAEGAKKAIARFGLGLGVLKKVDRNGKQVIVDSATGSPAFGLGTWMAAKGTQCVAKVKEEKDATGQYKTRYQIPYGEVHHVHDPRVADVPKNAEMASLIPVPPEFATPAPAASQPPAKTAGSAGKPSASSQPAPAAATDEFGEL